jgi:hypothetical protein
VLRGLTPPLRSETDQKAREILKTEHARPLSPRALVKQLPISLFISGVYITNGDIFFFCRLERSCISADKGPESIEKVPVSIENGLVSIERVLVSIENVRVSTEKVLGSIENVSVSTENVLVSTEKVQVSIGNLSVSIEKISVSIDEVRVSIERVSVSNTRQLFFHRVSDA